MGSRNDPHREQRTTQRPTAHGVDRRWAIWALGAGSLAAAGGWYLWLPAGAARAGNHPDPARGASIPATLSPALFVGRAAAAYQVAREIPETLARIYCYCRCDKSVGHTSLLSCYADDHASG